jgi:putative copper resistance protein D
MQTLAAILELLGLALLSGVSAGWLWLQPRRLSASRVPSLGRWLALALVLSLAGVCVDLLVRTAALQETTLAGAWPHVGEVVLRSDYGRFWLLHVSALLAMALLWAVSRGDVRPLRLAAPLAVLAAAFAIAGTGHTGEDGGLTVLAISDVVHVTAATLWGGMVLIYGFAIAPRLRHGLVPAAWVAESAVRLSALAGLALALVLASGLYNAWTLVGTIPALWQTDYGRTLAIKLTFVAVMMGIGFYNRYYTVPMIQAWARPPQLAAEADAPLGRLQTMLRIDALAVVLVIIMAALLGNTSPAAHGG